MEPIIDRALLVEFQNHTLVKMYAPELQTLQLRSLKSLVNEVFELGTPDVKSTDETPVTVVTLANYYYTKRIEELQNYQLPMLRQNIMEHLQSYN